MKNSNYSILTISFKNQNVNQSTENNNIIKNSINTLKGCNFNELILIPFGILQVHEKCFVIFHIYSF